MNDKVLEILKKVQEIRVNKNKSQDQIAELMGISQSKYARFESGKTKTDLKTLVLFCETLNMSLEDFFVYPNKIGAEDIQAVIQIRLKNKQKESILKQLIGKEDLEILNK